MYILPSVYSGEMLVAVSRRNGVVLASLRIVSVTTTTRDRRETPHATRQLLVSDVSSRCLFLWRSPKIRFSKSFGSKSFSHR